MKLPRILLTPWPLLLGLGWLESPAAALWATTRTLAGTEAVSPALRSTGRGEPVPTRPGADGSAAGLPPLELTQALPSSAPAPSTATALQVEAWALFRQGTEESRRRSLLLLSQAAEELQRSGDLAGLAQLREMEGLLLFALSRYRESNQAYGEALALYGRLGRPRDQTRQRLSLAMGALNLADYGAARRLLSQVQSEATLSNDSPMLSSALELEAQVEARSGNPQAAITLLERALALTAARGDRGHQLEILDAMALVHLPLGQLPQARAVLERRRALAPDQQSPVQALLQTLETRTRPEEIVSPEVLEGNIRRFRQAGDRTNTASSLEALAAVEVNRGQLRQGLAHYQEAFSLYEQQGMEGRAAGAQRNIGQTLAALGDYGRALEATGLALQRARKAGENTVQLGVLLDLAELQASLGSLEAALDSYGAGLTLAEQQRDRYREARALTALADLQRRLQHPQLALDLARRALAIGEAERMPLIEASALSTVVKVEESMGRLEPAMAAAERLQRLGSQMGDPWITALAEAMVARELLARGQPQPALAAVDRALPVFRSQDQMVALAAALDLRARVLAALGRRREALETYGQEEQACEVMGDRRCQADVLHAQSRLSAALDQPEQALALIRRSLAITESLRSTLPSADLRQSYFAQVQDQYDWCLELLLRLHRLQPDRRHDLRALEVSERARARGLVELLSAARAEIRSGVDPSLLERRRQLDGQIRELMAGRLRLRRSGNDPERASRLAELESRLAALQRQQQELELELRRSSPRYADLLLPRSLDAAAIQALLDDDTVLLEFHFGEQQGVLWLISRHGVETHPLPSRDAIQTLVTAFHAELPNGQGSPAAASLSRLLLQPVAARLAGKRLVIVPHGGLFYIPFAALPEPGGDRPLVVSHELIQLPSASSLAVLRTTPAPQTAGAPSLLVLADPVFGPGDPRLGTPPLPAAAPSDPLQSDETGSWQRLPGTAREAQTIATLLPPGSVQQLDLGFEASRRSLLTTDLTAYRWLHIATHGKADGRQPERSRLVLSLYAADRRPVEGNLRLQDIYNLRLAADLVVLSACQSGLGPLVRGEGLVGLTRGFQYAGARRVMASLWNVDDGSTAILMAAFYRGLLVDRLTPAAALRRAQLALLNDPATRAPYHWAAFTLLGDWR